MMSRNFLSFLLAAACLVVAQALTSAQSGRKPPRLSPMPVTTPAPTPPLVDATNFKQVKLIVSHSIENFVRDLNKQGRFGYRLEKSVSYGNNGKRRKYAAVLRLDPGHRYEYVLESWPKNETYGHPFNYQARRGYNLVHTYPVIQCPAPKYGSEANDPTNPDNWPGMKEILTVKDNVFLFMRRDGAKEQTREYKVFTGYFGLGSNPKEDIQAALDEAPPGFRPVSIFFWKQDWGMIRATLVAERDLNEFAPKKVEYRLVKELKGFDKEVNRLAADGSRYVGGGRISNVKVALMARQDVGAGDYTFLDDDKYAKEFDKLVAAGYSYQGMLAGDLNCDANDAVQQKPVFARDAAGATRQYKILSLPEPKTGLFSDPAQSELQRLADENFRVRDIFYSYGLKVILEK